MDEQRDAPENRPVAWRPGPPPAVPAAPAAPPPPDAGAHQGGSPLWTRLTRTPRGAAGLGIVAAALLLWPFSGWSLLPWLAGAGALVLLALLRLDRLLSGWVWHVAGLTVVAGLMISTSPWAWALAASIGVLVGGLLRLPDWRLAAVGGVLCVVSGVAYTLVNVQDAREQQLTAERRSAENFALVGERSPERVLPALLEGIGQGDVTAVCGLLDAPARDAFVRAAAAPDCASAVTAAQRAAGTAPAYEDLDATTVPSSAGWLTDACRTVWAQPPLGGPQLGRIEIRESDRPGRTYFVAGLRPC